MKLLYTFFSISSYLLCLTFASPLASTEISSNLEANSTPPLLSSRTIYLIRHAEKPLKGHGLSIKGELRSLCIRELLGPESDYNIGFITAMTPDGNKHLRHKQTVEPLAESLGLSVDTTCTSVWEDPQCLYRITEEYFRSTNDNKAVLISWRHSELSTIARVLGASDSPKKWKNRFDRIWMIKNGTFVSVTHQHCPGLDDLQSLMNDEAQSTISNLV